MNWKQYEQHVYGVFRRRYRMLYSVNKNERIKGRYSKVKRQIDVTMRPNIDREKMALIAIECKNYSRKINVKSIDSFIGFLGDINANIGIFVTNKGYSKGAENRAKHASISLEILNPSQLDTFFSGDVLCGGVCRYRCNNCNEERDFYCRDLDFEIVEAREREMGAEYCHSARWEDTCTCGQAIEIIIDIWEYPWGDPGYLDIRTYGCKLLKKGFFRIVRETREGLES